MKIWVKPGGPDRTVPIPPHRIPPRYFAPDLPMQVELDQYIQRRLDCGDLMQTEAPAAATPAVAIATAATAATPAKGV